MRKIIDALLKNETIMIALVSGVSYALLRKITSSLSLVRDWIEEKIYFKVTITEESQLFRAMNEWYVENHPTKMRNIFAKFDVNHKHGKPNYTLHITPSSTIHITSFNGSRMMIKKTMEYWKSEGEMVYEHEYTITSLAEKSVREFLKHLENHWNNKKTPGLTIITSTPNGYDSTGIFNKVVYKTFDDLFFQDKQKLIDYINLYLNSEELYRRKKIAYKTVILLGGSPGNGKTCTGFAIAGYTQRPIYYVNPRVFSTDESFQDYIMNIERRSIVLMEDVDSFFGNREDGTESKTSLSFSSILNTLDGLFSPYDVIFIMTTNKPEQLDDAMLRKGRLDLKIIFDNPTGNEINSYISHYFGEQVNYFPGDVCSSVPMVDIEAACKESENSREAYSKIKELC